MEPTINQKISHVIDTLKIKHYALAQPLGISRQAFSKKLKSGIFSESEIKTITSVLNMTRENLDSVDPENIQALITGNHTINGGTLVSCVMNFYLSGSSQQEVDKLVNTLNALRDLGSNKE